MQHRGESGAHGARRARVDGAHRFQGAISRHAEWFCLGALKPASMFLVLMGVFSFLFTDPGQAATHHRPVPVGLFR